VLGLPAGGTPVPLYRELVRLHREEGLSFAGVTAFNLDEYWPAPPGASFADFLREHLFRHVDLPPGGAFLLDGGVAVERVADECARFEAAIRAAGGVDLQILGLGLNGHIGFNEPGSGAETRTRRVRLAPDTVQRAARARAEWGGCTEAMSMGVATILEARRIVVLAFGAEKAIAVARARSGPETAEFPASFLRRHPRVAWYVDVA